MIIYSWNMLFRNRELDRAFEFIAKSDFDIFCLQEVPDKFLKRLQTLPCHLAETIDANHLFRVPSTHRAVILSHYKIIESKRIPFPDYWMELPWRAKALVWLLSSFGWSKRTNRAALFADVITPEGKVRVFNLHLVLATPEKRLREFEQSLAERDPSIHTIVCGDFNTIEAPHVSILSWLLGGRVSDTLLYRRERTHIEARFVEHELVNPLRGKVTHSFGGSQFDHILVSHSFSIKSASVLPDRIGSDHHPIRVEIE
jgi:endonuclease/exonuclease/phosphatase family metal-dependent hydrolase